MSNFVWFSSIFLFQIKKLKTLTDITSIFPQLLSELDTNTCSEPGERQACINVPWPCIHRLSHFQVNAYVDFLFLEAVASATIVDPAALISSSSNSCIVLDDSAAVATERFPAALRGFSCENSMGNSPGCSDNSSYHDGSTGLFSPNLRYCEVATDSGLSIGHGRPFDHAGAMENALRAEVTQAFECKGLSSSHASAYEEMLDISKTVIPEGSEENTGKTKSEKISSSNASNKGLADDIILPDVVLESKTFTEMYKRFLDFVDSNPSSWKTVHREKEAVVKNNPVLNSFPKCLSYEHKLQLMCASQIFRKEFERKHPKVTGNESDEVMVSRCVCKVTPGNFAIGR